MKWLFACIGIVLMMVCCKTSKEAVMTSTPLFDTKWSLKKIYDNGKQEYINSKAFIRFDKEKGSAGGNGSCNSFGSTASVQGNEVNFKNIFSTKMYCEQVQQIENKFLRSLETVNRYEIKDKTLMLFNHKELMLAFTAEIN